MKFAADGRRSGTEVLIAKALPSSSGSGGSHPALGYSATINRPWTTATINRPWTTWQHNGAK